MKLVNVMEHLVFEAIDEVRKRQPFCNCDACRLDIAALALNSLPPRYVVTSKGEAYGRADWIDLQKDIDLFSTVLKAIQKVESSPRHGAQES